MLAEIPRIPIFPEYMISKEIKRIERDVQDEVIPVSAGIYSEHKLVQKLQAIPKPQTVNYQDPIFYQIVDNAKYPCKINQCPLCRQEFGNKKNIAVQCHFCGNWNCSECICPRKRYHPRAKENNSQRYSICYKCDDKFLNLTLNHGYIQSKALLEEVSKRIRKQKDQYQTECEKIQKEANYVKELNNKNKFIISSMKKQQVDNKKNIAKMSSLKEEDSAKLKVREKYLQILMRKKQKLSLMEKLQKEKKEPQVHQNNQIQIQSPKSIRSLSQSNVYSQNISIGLNNEKDNSTFIKTQQNSFALNQQETLNTQGGKMQYFYNDHSWALQKKDQPSNLHTPISLLRQQQPHHNYQSAQQMKDEQEQPFQKIELPQEQPQQYSQDDGQSVQSLDPQVIKTRKAALMKEAIQTSNRTRFQITDRSFSYSQPSKCNCQIY